MLEIVGNKLAVYKNFKCGVDMGSAYFHLRCGNDVSGNGTMESPFGTLEKAMATAGDERCGFRRRSGDVHVGEDLFVDATAGDDANDGLRPERAMRSPMTAWTAQTCGRRIRVCWCW